MTRPRPHPLLGSLVFLAILGSASHALAQGSTAKVAAETLFEEGRRLMTENKAAEACPKFAESQRLDPSPSTLLNLANCYEKSDRPATAWATYREGASAALAAGRQDMVTTAQRHADALFSTLPRLSVTVAAPADGMNVLVDGVAVGRAQWGVALPVDPGEHSVEANAPHFKPWSTKVTVARGAATVPVPVPALDAAPAEAVPSPAPTPAPLAPAAVTTAPPPDSGPSPGHTQRVIGAVVGVVGIVGLGVGGGFALNAKSTYTNSLTQCPNTPNRCTQAGVTQRESARSSGDIASVAVALGSAALVAGIVTWFTAPSATSTKTAKIELLPTLGGAMVRGQW